MSAAGQQRVLITGATGYIGGRLARHLAEHARFDTVLGSRQEFATAAGSRSAESNSTWVHTDYSDPAALRRACKDVDCIVHLAGANAQTCAANPVHALTANAVATASLCAAAASSGVQRLIYLSTAHVYGSPLRGRISEETCPRGIHPYAASHRAAEDAVLHARQRGQIDGVVVRLSNSFGPPASAASDCWMLLVPQLCRQAATLGSLKLESSGMQRRDFVTLSDACSALAHLMALESTGEGLFNVGGQWTPTVREMAERIAALCPRVLGHSVSLEVGTSTAVEQSDDLEYNVDRLLASGFRLSRQVDAELAATLEFCAAQFSRASTAT